MVDAVISFEGEGGRDLRLLRAVKNRFGPTDEIGVFEMTGRGLAEVANPSALFLSARDAVAPGAAVFRRDGGFTSASCGVSSPCRAKLARGLRAAPWLAGTPSRLAMVVAVLEAHAGLKLGQYDIYLSVAGGLRVGEPAADLAAAAASDLVFERHQPCR